MNNNSIQNNLLAVHLPLFATQFFFSVLPVFSKLAFINFSPGSVIFFRVVCAAVLFALVFFLFKRERIKETKHYFYFAAFAFFGVAGNQYMFLQGVSRTTAINASLLISSIPIFTLVVAILFRKEKFSAGKFLGVLIALFGVINIIGLESFEFGEFFWGNILIIGNSLMYSIYLVISKPFLQIYKPFTLVTYIFIFASIEIIPITFEEVANINYAAVEMNGYVPLFVLVFFGTILPYLINNLALKRTYSSIVAIYTYLQPVFGGLLAIFVLGETLSLKLVLSGFLIIAGMSLVSFPGVVKNIKSKITFGRF